MKQPKMKYWTLIRDGGSIKKKNENHSPKNITHLKNIKFITIKWRRREDLTLVVEPTCLLGQWRIWALGLKFENDLFFYEYYIYLYRKINSFLYCVKKSSTGWRFK